MPADFCSEQSPADQHQAESGLSPAETGPSSVLIAVKVTLFSLEFGGSSSDSPLYVEFPAQNKILFTIIQLKPTQEQMWVRLDRQCSDGDYTEPD